LPKKKEKEKGGIDVPSLVCNKNNNDKGVNIMFPLVYGVCNEDDNMGTLCSPPFLTPITKTLMVKG
jgi:hypothetical protein